MNYERNCTCGNDEAKTEMITANLPEIEIYREESPILISNYVEGNSNCSIKLIAVESTNNSKPIENYLLTLDINDERRQTIQMTKEQLIALKASIGILLNNSK